MPPSSNPHIGQGYWHIGCNLYKRHPLAGTKSNQKFHLHETASMSVVIEKKPLILLGYTDIDEDHQAFTAAVAQILCADNVSFPTLFKRLLTHTQIHFERENKYMEASRYPAAAEQEAVKPPPIPHAWLRWWPPVHPQGWQWNISSACILPTQAPG